MNRTMLAALVAAVAAPAVAQDGYYGREPQRYPDPYVDYAPIPEDTAVFSGLRVEGRIGYDTLKLGELAGDDDVTFDRHGLSYGGEVGFDFNLGSALVLGLYGGVDGSTVKACEQFFGTATACLRSRRLINAGGRIGVQLGRNALLYAKGGYSNGGLTVTYRDPTAPADNFDFRQNLEGFHVGGGLEANLTRGFYGKVEYVFTRLDRPETDDDADIGNVDRHQVNAGLGVRF